MSKRLKLAKSNKQTRLDKLENDWKDCEACNLSANRTQVVFGHGNLEASLMVIGEAPGENEDEQGIPFVGKAGTLFNKILESVSIRRKDIWITNTCLCRPPNNRNPYAKEIKACQSRLLTEMSIVSPSVVVLIGNIPLFAMTKKKGITKNRGWVDTPFHFPVYATLHPASLFHGSAEQIEKKKQMVWDDWKVIAARLEELNG